MKKLILSILLLPGLLFFSIHLEAQVTEKSNFLVGGSVSFTTSKSDVEITEDGQTNKTDGPKNTVFTFEPVVAYFLFPNVAIGGQVQYIKEKITINNDKNESDNLLLGPVARYYVPFLEGDAALFLEVDAAFGSSSDDKVINNESVSTKNTVSQIGVGPGLTFFVNDLIGLEAIAKYNFNTTNAEVSSPTIDYKQKTNANEFDFQIGLQFYFSRND